MILPDYELFSPTYIWFKRYMEPRGISQKSVCQATGIPPSTFTQMLKGAHSLTVEKCQILSDFSNIDIRILLQLNHVFKCVTNLINGFPEMALKQDLIYKILHATDSPDE